MLHHFSVTLLLFQTWSAWTQWPMVYEANNGWDLGNDFILTNSSRSFSIVNNETAIWGTVPGKAFVSASAGDDTVIESNGSFNITQVDIDTCQDQNVTSIAQVAWHDTVTGSAVQVAGYLLDCGNVDAPYTLTFWVPSILTDRVAFYLNIISPVDAPRTLKKLYLRYASTADEDFYGLGAQASFASLKNQSIPIFTREQGVGRGDQPITSIENENGTFAGGDQLTTYTAVPSYISTQGNIFYLGLKSTGYANFDFTSPDTVDVRYDSLSVDGMFLRAIDMFEGVEKLTQYTGRMPALPTWVDNGAVLGLEGGEARIYEVVQQGIDIDCPITAVWLQDWCGIHSQAGPFVNVSRLWWNWENDEDLYPTWVSFVQNLRSTHNIRTLSYINPFLTNVSTKSDGYRRNLYAEAAAAGYFVQNTTTNSTAIISSGPGLSAGIIDLTNPDLLSWFTSVLQTQVYNANISGFMSDFGEYTPITSDTRLYSVVTDAFFFHNHYPYLWAQFQRSLANSLGMKDEALIFHRSASMGANKYINLFWAGDQNLNWSVNDGIKSVVTVFLHMGLSGYSQLHSDIGGYTDTLTYQDYNCTRDAELLGRWGELAAVSSAVFRSHEGNIPEVNAQFYSNATTYAYYAYNARMFVALGPYRRRVLATECETRGWPLLRPPVMYHPQDRRARQISYQSFYLGPSLYVAPVLDSGTLELVVYLPVGNYTHVWSGVRFESRGMEVRVATPYGQPAVFVVEGREVAELESFLDFVRKENGTGLSAY